MRADARVRFETHRMPHTTRRAGVLARSTPRRLRPGQSLAAWRGIPWISSLSHLKVIAHLVAQKISRPIDARLHRSFARLQDQSDLVITLAFDVSQHERRAILIRQSSNRALDHCTPFGIDEADILQRPLVRRVKVPGLLAFARS